MSSLTKLESVKKEEDKLTNSETQQGVGAAKAVQLMFTGHTAAADTQQKSGECCFSFRCTEKRK